MTAPLSVLIVGAGAVGQVYGHHLARGGARVTFYVRERYRDEAARGFTMIRLRGKRRREVSRFEGFNVVTSAAEVAGRRFDQVYLTIPSTGLAGSWLPALVAALGDATLVAMTPSPGDADIILAAGMAPERIVPGLITLISYHAPLAGEPADMPSGMAYWFPPGSHAMFSGPKDRAEAVVAALRAGGQPAKLVADVPRQVAFPNAVFQAFLVALESAHWSLADLRRGPQLALGVAGAREALAIAALSSGKPPLAIRILVRAWILRIALRIIPGWMPLPLETYLRAHFTKVGAQTRHAMKTLIQRGRAATISVARLEQLMASVPELPTASTAPIVARMGSL